MSFSLRYAGVSGSLGWSQHVNFRSLLLYFCVWLRCLTWVAPFTPLCGLYSLLLFFSFLRKSNLVLPTPNLTCPKVPRRLDLYVSPNGAFLHIRATKTIQFFQRALSIPLSIILGSLLCPVTALINHLRLNSVGPSDSLFSVRSPSTQSTQPITYYHFSKFLAKVVTAFGLDTRD